MSEVPMRSSALSPATTCPALSVIDADRLGAALALRDLTDPARGSHAMQVLLDEIVAALAAAWSCEVRVHRALPVISARDNYDRLYYPPDGVARDARYTRWLGRDVLLRTHTSALVPPALDDLAGDPSWRDVLLVCPGLVYRRDCIDRYHVGEPHQVDLWRIRRGGEEVLGRGELLRLVDLIAGSALPGWRVRTSEAEHPYTVGGLQVDAARDEGDEQVEIGECGLALPRLLSDTGHDPGPTSGLALGLGLDRLLMLRKGIPDIRLLRAGDSRIAEQMADLAPWRPVSAMPAVRRDLSIAVDADDRAEDLGDRVRAALGARAGAVESVEVLSDTAYESLPEPARARLGIAPGQKNLLVRVVLRDLERTLTHEEANGLRDAVYAAIHRGTVHQWARRSP
jgi:phenylalanyl-tRNA synthetase alpha chain